MMVMMMMPVPYLMISHTIHEENIDINFICLVANLPPDIISLVTELCVLGMLFQKEKLIFSLSIVLEQA